MEKGEIIGRGARAVVYALPAGRALKLYHPTTDPRLIEAVEREAGIGRAVYEAGLRAPRVYGTVFEDGAPGIIYERIEGQDMLHELFARPESARRLAAQMAELHAAIHQRTVPGLPRAKASLEESLARLRVPQAFADLGDLTAAALRALGALADGDSLCHGDFHPLNILMSPRGPVAIDWTNACLGAPAADVARTTLLLKLLPAFIPEAIMPAAQVEALTDEFRRAYLDRYRELSPLAGCELAAWELPLAVARISEDLPAETARLRAIIAAHLTND